MKKHILVLSILLYTSGPLYAKKGVTIVNKTTTAIGLIEKSGIKTIDSGEKTFLPAEEDGQMAIEWKQGPHHYETQKYSNADTIYIKNKGVYDLKTGGFWGYFGTIKKNIKAKITKIPQETADITKKATQMIKKGTRFFANLAEKATTVLKKGATAVKKVTTVAIKVRTLEEALKKAEPKIYETIGILEVLTEQLQKEAKIIKAKIKSLPLQKTIAVKIQLFTEILKQNVKPLVIDGLYPLLDSLISLLTIIGKEIVPLFDKKTAQKIQNFTEKLKNLKTKSKTSKNTTILEYVDLVEEILINLKNLLKNMKLLTSSTPNK